MVDDVVEPRGQLVDVLALERRDEGGVQLVECPMRDVVALVLDVLHLAHALVEAVPPLEHLLEQARGIEHLGGELIEQIEEAGVPGKQSEWHPES